MAHIKYVSPSGWDFDRPIAVQMKYSSRGLRGNDLRDFTKMAGHSFVSQLDNIKIAKDEIPIHLIALGGYEHYGLNRNGDGFTKSACEKCHSTFVKFARFFRNHKNKPDRGDPHFGIVKASAWNDPMKRVELIVALNAEKSAADRNGGFLADIELQKIANEESIAVSMACRIPYDVCNYCEKQSATRAEYCTADNCGAGGCTENLSRMVKIANDLFHVGVLNPNPVWFDISRVFRPADRIAFGGKADYLTKAAADDGIFSIADSIKMAEDATAPLGVIMYQDGLPGAWTARIVGQVKLAAGLAVLESQEQGHSPVYSGLDTQPINVDSLGEPGTEKCAETLSALADKKIILTLRDFAKLTRQSDFAKQASYQLQGIYTRLLDSDRLERIVEQNRFMLSDKTASDRSKSVALANFSGHSLAMDAINNRSMIAAANGFTPEIVKEAAFNPQEYCASSTRLAESYAAYKLDALEHIARHDDNLALTARLAVRQNHLTL